MPHFFASFSGATTLAPVAAAFATLLTGGSASAIEKKARNRPCRKLPAETFVEVMLFADRDTLDTMQLVCSFLLDFIRERELTKLALRDIPQVTIGRSYEDEDGTRRWLPLVDMVRNRGNGKEHLPKSVYHLTSCLRMAFCESVCINLIGTPEPEPSPTYFNVCDMFFHDLAATSTFAGTLTFTTFFDDVDLVTRGIEAFKSVKRVSKEWDHDYYRKFLVETFFVSAAQHGVRHIELKPASGVDTPADTIAALSFGFAEPTAGGDRSLLGVACEIGSDFLEQIKQKVAALDGARHIDFNFKLANVSSPIDSTGFEMYQKDEDDRRTWLMNDLENHISVEVKQTERLFVYGPNAQVQKTKYFVEIHVFSSG